MANKGKSSAKGKVLAAILIVVVMALLAVLGWLIYVIVDNVSSIGDRDRDRDRGEETTEAVSVDDTNVTEDAPMTDDVPVTVGATDVEEPDVTVENLPTEQIFEDGSKETYAYDANGNVTEKVCYNADGEKTARYVYTYDGETLIREKEYNAAEKLAFDTVYSNDGSVVITEWNYDESLNITGGCIIAYRPEGQVREIQYLNKFGGVTSIDYFDEEGGVILTREYHFNAAGYRDGYTDTDASGNSVRYNEDGTEYKESEVTTTAKPKPKPQPKPQPQPEVTTAATTEATTAAPKPAEPQMYTESSRVGSDLVVKYYKVNADGSKTLSNTITYRTINGKEVELVNIDEIRGYGRQNEYDQSGNLLSFLTYNVKYGKRTLEIYHDANGNVLKSKKYEYDGQNRKVREEEYDSSDNLTGFITYEFIAGKDGSYKTKVISHDAKGNVISSYVK